MRTYYIYKVTNVINNKIYIGKTSNFTERKWQHERCYEKEDCVFHRAIKHYGKENFKWEIIDKANSLEKIYELEKKYIKEYDSFHPNGYNMTKGGAGGSMWNARPIVRLSLDGKFIKRYDSAGQAKNDGFHDSDVLRCCKGLQLRCKDSLFMFEDEYETFGPKTYQKPESSRCKPVLQFDKDGKFIAEYKSITEASQKSGANRTTIIGALKGNYKLANGFIFVYKENFSGLNAENYIPNKKGIKIAQVDPNTGEIIDKFDRIADAGRKLNVNYKVIHRALNKKTQMAYGYKWIKQ